MQPFCVDDDHLPPPRRCHEAAAAVEQGVAGGGNEPHGMGVVGYCVRALCYRNDGALAGVVAQLEAVGRDDLGWVV
jgi:hypothetical protein